MMVAVNDGTGLQYLLTDHLGSTVAVTNSSGTLTSQQRYLPFGEVRQLPNYPTIALTDYGYTGQRKLDDGMGGIMDYKARFYSPYLNQFIQPDTIIPDQTNPQSWNRFSYVQNNPIRFNDPTGHMLDEGDGGGCYKCTVRPDLEADLGDDDVDPNPGDGRGEEDNNGLDCPANHSNCGFGFETCGQASMVDCPPKQLRDPILPKTLFLKYTDLTDYTVKHGFLNGFLREIRVIRVQKRLKKHSLRQ